MFCQQKQGYFILFIFFVSINSAIKKCCTMYLTIQKVVLDIFRSLYIQYWLISHSTINRHVGEVSSRFDFFQRIFTYLSVSKKLTSVSYRTRRALSNGTIRFSVDQSMAQKISKYRVFLIKFRHYIRVKATYIHLLYCVNSKDTCVRYNSTSSI